MSKNNAQREKNSRNARTMRLMTATRKIGARQAECSEGFHSVRAIADRWQSSERHVRRLIARGELIAHRFGSLVRVSDPDLHEYERTQRDK